MGEEGVRGGGSEAVGGGDDKDKYPTQRQSFLSFRGARARSVSLSLIHTTHNTCQQQKRYQTQEP